ncbi:SidA/IucD/PvdA family monooxygenase [Actinomadura sp. LD22]|uniref:SidA/IucD/PvdA family monooxygenase n=1 Tax=Actinomadura physcomitrii TaxID=2650748 RepID=A0A6I4MFI2_9ACTN|nr:NAD(P)/FAD-dependent oxidoreductase [Actinomadura physcomitrii]MWA02924.1 SidA/IucD/PvdA family monooxygenase [Actinomadura physcomitrii]
MSVVEAPPSLDVESAFGSWLARFDQAVTGGAAEAVAGEFEPDGYWRDILALTWRYHTYSGRGEIRRALGAGLLAQHPRNLRPAADRTPPRLVKRSSRMVIEAYFDFDTDLGRGTGFVRLLVEDDRLADAPVWILLTALQELAGFEERTGKARPTGLEYSHGFAGGNWLDRREEAAEYADRDPEVIVVGAGQSGLVLGARLNQLGVDTLLLERTPRVGDVWRNRYHSLTLHNEVWANSLPYLPFPPTWPTFLPKDKLAGWLEGYAEYMELNVWTATDFEGAAYDEDRHRWTVRVNRGGKQERVLHPRHLVLATGGVSGTPHLPEVPGLDDFAGTVVHSSAFGDGRQYDVRDAIVLGTGNSGHDVAQELHARGVSVTMIQRSPTCVVSLVPSGTMVYALYSEHDRIEDIDLITAAIPYPVLRESYQFLTRKTCRLDQQLLDRLNAAGFETDFEPDGTGFHMKYLRRGGGYYINVGCSDLIADGEIKIVQARDSDGFGPAGLRLKDGRTVPADLVVLATGYENQQESVRRLLGDAVADKVGPIWGFDEDHELRNMWRPTGQENLWIMGGNLLESRLHSRFLALQIKADIEGLTPTAAAGHDGR